MKKLILVMICTLIITIFIAFNYLLWDRENKIKNIENLNISKNTSIDALGEKIKTLDDINKQLKISINQLENDNKILQTKYAQVNLEKQKIEEMGLYKNEVINKLKRQANLKPMEEKVVKWVEDIDKGQYKAAYEVLSRQFTNKENNMSSADFENRYKNDIKSIKVKSIKLYVDDAPDYKKETVVFIASLDVKKAEKSSTSLFDEGLNERYFTFAYDKEKDDWFISDIAIFPY